MASFVQILTSTYQSLSAIYIGTKTKKACNLCYTLSRVRKIQLVNVSDQFRNLCEVEHVSLNWGKL